MDVGAIQHQRLPQGRADLITEPPPQWMENGNTGQGIAECTTGRGNGCQRCFSPLVDNPRRVLESILPLRGQLERQPCCPFTSRLGQVMGGTWSSFYFGLPLVPTVFCSGPACVLGATGERFSRCILHVS